MKYILVCLLFAVPFISHASKEEVTPKIEYYAAKYHVPLEVMDYIVEHESGYNRNVVGDMHLTCKRNGKPVRARGLVQITECYWPNITDEQALDDDFALDFLGYWLSRGYCRWWSTCPIRFTLASKFFEAPTKA